MPEAFRVLVVEDEAPARSKVKRLLEGDARFTWAGEAKDGPEALDQVAALRPDLLILDIQMPGLTGFEVLEALESPRPQVVFSTAFDAHALAAFEAQALDYLLKPYDAERFQIALDRAHAQLLAAQPSRSKAVDTLLAQRPLERLIVKDGDRWLPLSLARVRRLSVEGKQVKVFAEGLECVIRGSLSDLEQRLDPRRFIRVHRSDLVALDAVAHLEPWDHGDALLVLKDGSKVVLSRTHRAAFLARWGIEL